MKHRITVEEKTRKHFLGIPYTVTEKKRMTVDGKAYRRMKEAEKERKNRETAETLACAAIILEEEWAEQYGE